MNKPDAMTGTMKPVSKNMLNAAIEDMRKGSTEPFRITMPPALYRHVFDGVDVSDLTVAEVIDRLLNLDGVGNGGGG